MDTINKIKYEASILFGELGYADTSMRTIARKVGIKASSIYSHYKSKEVLFIDTFETCVKEYNIGINIKDDLVDMSLKEMILEILRKKICFLEENPRLLKFLARNIFFPPNELKDKLQLIIEENMNISHINIYHKVYHDLKRDKKIKDALSIELFISIFEMCFIGYIIENIGLNYYQKQGNIEDMFNLYWEEMVLI